MHLQLQERYHNLLLVDLSHLLFPQLELCNSKDTVVAFLDGDRAGGFILKELKSVVQLDYELRADNDVEVEELTPQRIDEILKPVADEIKDGKPVPSLKSENDKPIADIASKIYPN